MKSKKHLKRLLILASICACLFLSYALIKDKLILENYNYNGNEEPLEPLSDKDFIVKNGNIVIELGSDYKDLEIDEKILSISYANERRAYDIFVFENFTISSTLKIFMITLTTPAFETFRGVRLGDSILSVFEKYGIADSSENGLYSYYYNYKILIFYVDENNTIIGIRLEYV